MQSQAQAEWIDQSSMEYLSVASFSKFALQLARYGAPLDLIEECHLFSLDELRHANICRMIANRSGSVMKTSLTFDQLPKHCLKGCEWDELTFLRETVSSGCVGEAISACESFVQAKIFDHGDTDTNELLLSIAYDEVNHCLLGWKVALWWMETKKKGWDVLLKEDWWRGIFEEQLYSRGRRKDGDALLLSWGIVDDFGRDLIARQCWDQIIALGIQHLCTVHVCVVEAIGAKFQALFRA